MNDSKKLTITHTANIAYPGDMEYSVLSRLVQSKYFSKYNATISPKPDLFVYTNFSENMENFSGACFGLTFAKDKDLFSERYLDEPVEKIIKDRFDIDSNRNNIAELGSLISYNSIGAGRFLIRSIPSIVKHFNLDALLITSTSQLSEIYAQTGIHFEKITNALQSRLGNDYQSNWGSYYETNPITGIVLTHTYTQMTPINQDLAPASAKIAPND